MWVGKVSFQLIPIMTPGDTKENMERELKKTKNVHITIGNFEERKRKMRDVDLLC